MSAPRTAAEAPRPTGVLRLRLNLALVIGSALTALFIAVALLSLVWTPEAPTRVRVAMRLKAPLELGLLGTDHFGRDVVSLLMAGAWNSLVIAWPAVLLGAAVGTAIGCAAAALRGAFEEIAMRASDVVFAFPAVLSAIMLGALVGSGPFAAVLAIAVFNVPVFARVSRGVALQVWTFDYVAAARSLGKHPWRITWEDVLPNIAGVLIVQATIQLALAILTEAGLSYLGLGIRPPNPSWGRMLSDAQTYLAQAPHLAIVPGVAIALSVLGLNLLGDGLRDALDPTLRGREV
jgi:peptide/nickel transport system permease protein